MSIGHIREAGKRSVNYLNFTRGLSSKQLRVTFAVIALEATLVICWSSGFVGVRYAANHAPIFLILFWRSVAAALLLLPLAVLKGPPVSARAIKEQGLIGLLAMFGYLAGYASAIGLGVPTGLVALIADMVPLTVAVLSLAMLGQPLTGRQWTGIIIGFAGVLIISADSLHLGTAPWYAYILALAGMASLALATVVQKRWMKPTVSLLQSLCIQCSVAATVFAVCAWLEGGLAPPITVAFATGIAWLVIFATFGGYGLYYLALRFSSPTRVSSVLYLSPPVTMIWAWAVFSEPLSQMMFVGLSVSLIGIVIARRQEK